MGCRDAPTGKSTALEKAMDALRKDYPEERYWAPFVVFGAED